MSVMSPAEFATAMGLAAPAAPASGLPDQPGLYIPYLTKTGDRWDTIAYANFGDATQISALIMANPGVAIVDVFDAGTALAIPLIGQPSGGVSSSPPWAS
jgi:phage tail protein X